MLFEENIRLHEAATNLDSWIEMIRTEHNLTDYEILLVLLYAAGEYANYRVKIPEK